MGKSFGRNDGIMIDSQAVAVNANGVPLSNALLHKTATLNAASVTVSDSRITANHRICNATFGTPSSLASDVSWTTSGGKVVFTQTLATGTTTTIDFDLILFNT